MTERKVNTQFPVIFQNIEKFEKEDSRFLKVRIWLLHTGLNYNGSFFSKEAVDKAIPTLANTPILSFIEENSQGEQDFSDHRIVLKRTEDGELEFKYLGTAVGVIPEANNAHWEMRVSDQGEELEYLVVDALMWTKWGEPTDIMSLKGQTAQSMELASDYTGYYDDNNVFHFETFSFFGACLLGSDVAPAMQNSTVEVQFAKNDDLKNKIENKLQEFYTLFSQQGGTEMTEETKPEVEIEQVEAEFEQTEVVEPEVEVVEEQPEAEVEAPEESFEAETVEATEVVEAEVEPVVEEEVVESIDYEAKFNDLTTEFEQLQSKLSELEELKSYKRNREEMDVQAKFADKLSEEEFTQVFEAMKEASIADVEDKLFALYGKKNFSVKQSATQTNKAVFSLPEATESVQNPYGDIFK